MSYCISRNDDEKIQKPHMNLCEGEVKDFLSEVESPYLYSVVEYFEEEDEFGERLNGEEWLHGYDQGLI